jgi:hypothetical protein
LKGVIKREDAIIAKAKKEHDRIRATARKTYIEMEVNNNKEDYLAQYKSICPISDNTMQESEVMADEPLKESPID